MKRVEKKRIKNRAGVKEREFRLKIAPYQVLLAVVLPIVFLVTIRILCLKENQEEILENEVRKSNFIQQKPTQSKKEKKGDCALLFFGLPKHFKKRVLPSIKKNIIQYNPTCDVYLHTYNIEILPQNKRNYEPQAKLHIAEVFELTKNVILDSETNFHQARNLTYYRLYFPYNKKSWHYPQSLDNMIKQWHSIDSVFRLMLTQMWKFNKNYKRVGLFRSDLLYLNPISIFSYGHAVTPDFGLINASQEVNDRFFFGLLEYAKIWANRFDPTSFQSYVSSELGYQIGLHSETYLHFLLTKNNVPFTRGPFCANRMRVTGKPEHDCWCDEKERPKVCTWWIQFLENRNIKYPKDWKR